jgi:5-(carboxyamino)imidazole ribonucleotide synthase
MTQKAGQEARFFVCRYNLGMKTLGIVGGGQLGRMLAEAARKLGFKTVVLDPTPDSPAGQAADEQILGEFTDPEKVKALGEAADYITFEIESADDSALKALSATGKPVNPSPDTLAVIKDKYLQKVFLRENGIGTTDFTEVKTPEDAKEAGNAFGYPYVLKAKHGSYDGRGNLTIESEADIPAALEKFSGKELYAEKWVPFEKELAVMAARAAAGDIALFPVVETVHKNHILDVTLAPAPAPEAARQKADDFARSVMEHLKGQGVFGIEMFLTKEGEVLVNEIAPRVHNSGHYTIEACETSQFEEHVRAVTGMPLGPASLKVPAAVMINILGERSGAAEPKGIEEAEAIPGVSVHIYGKKEVRPARKMGHITVVADTLEEALEKAKKARNCVSI